MIVIHGTKKFRDRVGGPLRVADDVGSSTALGDWYATVLFWKPQVALFVNEEALLPVLVRLAPANTVIDRFVDAFAQALAQLGAPQAFINDEVAEMAAAQQVAKTNNRSVVGIMNEFAFLASSGGAAASRGLLDLSIHLAATPCSPLYGKHVSPDRQVLATVATWSARSETRDMHR